MTDTTPTPDTAAKEARAARPVGTGYSIAVTGWPLVYRPLRGQGPWLHKPTGRRFRHDEVQERCRVCQWGPLGVPHKTPISVECAGGRQSRAALAGRGDRLEER